MITYILERLPEFYDELENEYVFRINVPYNLTYFDGFVRRVSLANRAHAPHA